MLLVAPGHLTILRQTALRFQGGAPIEFRIVMAAFTEQYRVAQPVGYLHVSHGRLILLGAGVFTVAKKMPSVRRSFELGG